MSDEHFTCSKCGKPFDMAPEGVCETGLGGVLVPEDQIEELEASGEGYTFETLEAMNEYQLKEIGLTPEAVRVLREENFLTTGAEIICPGCQDHMEESADEKD